MPAAAPPRFQLLVSPTSPFARAVMVFVHERGLADDIDVEHKNPFTDAQALIVHHPIGRVPTLVRPGEKALVDSRLICRFLDEIARTAHPKTPPPKENDTWSDARLATEGHDIAETALRLRLEQLRPEDKQMASECSHLEGRILRLIAALKPSGQTAPTTGDIFAACALLYVDFRQGHLAWRRLHPGLAEWVDGLSARPSFARTPYPQA